MLLILSCITLAVACICALGYILYLRKRVNHFMEMAGRYFRLYMENKNHKNEENEEEL